MKKQLWVLLMLVGLAAFVSAQNTPGKDSIIKIAKFKPPTVKTYLGKYAGMSNTCTVSEGKQLIILPIRIADDKNVTYEISTYQFAYTRRGITEDETTGQTAPQSDVVAQRFTETPLPKLWQTNINEQLHSGEELYYFDIIVKDKKGRLFFAPDLKIVVE